MKLLPRHQLRVFIDPRSGEEREPREPDGPATGRQLHRLNRAGLLALVEPEQVTPLTKAEAPWTIDALTAAMSRTDEGTTAA